ncbi:amino acid transporter [Peteryoungia desertarenae]|uniref:Amino acid transporter n=1 Tax=Peteryoungia desertarenae TaxID=1813451 RepID=A0ABX6QRT5_9HYPH|nr:LysE/ArgO family amino acid transporter [Peteryoungia desertarenae]QLF70907.1 amino acid transporter [Peteryoungia desertarenae]
MILALTAGFFLGLSLIVAIGAQNAFVLKLGLQKQHVLAVVLVCALSDAMLITLGVAGFGTIMERMDWLVPAMRYGGAAFLTFYAFRSLLSAYRGGNALNAAFGSVISQREAILTALALTWLNPHVYLDTVILLGSISLRYSEHSFAFGLGAVTASFTFFFSLGFGARLLAPLFARPIAWRILDVGIALVMLTIAASLLR